MNPVYPLTTILLMNTMLLTQSAVTNSTFILPRSVNEEGHHPGRQAGTDPFKEFRNSKNTVEINGERCKINNPIAEDGPGNVYTYTAIKNTIKVSIKVINNAPAGSEPRKQAMKEIAFLEALAGSANVVTILQWEVKGSSVAIVMEWCNLTLHEWMVQRKVFGNGLIDPKESKKWFVILFRSYRVWYNKCVPRTLFISI